MKYIELRAHFCAFHRGEISKAELSMLIAMWQSAGAML